MPRRFRPMYAVEMDRERSDNKPFFWWHRPNQCQFHYRRSAAARGQAEVDHLAKSTVASHRRASEDRAAGQQVGGMSVPNHAPVGVVSGVGQRVTARGKECPTSPCGQELRGVPLSSPLRTCWGDLRGNHPFRNIPQQSRRTQKDNFEIVPTVTTCDVGRRIRSLTRLGICTLAAYGWVGPTTIVLR